MRLRFWLIALSASAAPAVWEIAIAIAIRLSALRLPELTLLVVAKLGFAAVLAMGLTIRHGWRRNGFGGGWQWRRWGLLWPLWLGAATSLAQVPDFDKSASFPGWLLVALAVSFGEEGIFRGIVLGSFIERPRRAAVLSAFLFGAVHLVGLVAPIDSRMIVAQAIAAACLGLILGCTRLITGSILPGLVAHAALDFGGLIAADGFTEAMSYSDPGIIFMLCFAIVSLIWGIVLYRRLPI